MKHIGRGDKMKGSKKSCGNCKHYVDVGFLNWGECNCLVPYSFLAKQLWVDVHDDSQNMCFNDGGEGDYGEECEAYELKT